jgi:hypothetical protein
MRRDFRTRGSMCLAAMAMLFLGLFAGGAPAAILPVWVYMPPPPPPAAPPPPPPSLPPPPPLPYSPPPTPPSFPPGEPPGEPPGTPPGTAQNLPEPATVVTGLVGSSLVGLYAALRRKRQMVEE